MAVPRKKQIPPSKDSFEVIGVRVDSELRRKLEDIAKSEERTISQLTRIALREFLERRTAQVVAQ